MTYKKILNSIESKGFNKILWNRAGKAMHKYNMIESNDRIAIGISGGKDSMVLFNTLVRLKLIVDFEFEIFPIYISYTDNIENISNIKNYINSLGYDLIIKTTNIRNIVFTEKNESNPCALCSRLRRGSLYTLMNDLNLNKLALGHHLDDIIETYFMNMFYQGNIKQMLPKYISEEYGFHIIRPLSYVTENTIIKYTNKVDIPILISDCSYNNSKESKRKKMKDIINLLEKDNKDIRSCIKKALDI
ncbi:MAG: tRNA 2-thiocytidine(32) synthetase TtcA [Fusobacteria bacterium]|nr:tRNA 2-thiocytidine(32) synthetase TtcA [Fusobacteriota bacterium]